MCPETLGELIKSLKFGSSPSVNDDAVIGSVAKGPSQCPFDDPPPPAF